MPTLYANRVQSIRHLQSIVEESTSDRGTSGLSMAVLDASIGQPRHDMPRSLTLLPRTNAFAAVRPDRFVSASCSSREEFCRALEALPAAFTHHLIYYYYYYYFKRLTKGISKCSLRFPASESLYWSCGASWKQQNETISVRTATHGVGFPKKQRRPAKGRVSGGPIPLTSELSTCCSLRGVSFSGVHASQGPTRPPWGVSFSGVHASQDPGIHVT